MFIPIARRASRLASLALCGVIVSLTPPELHAVDLAPGSIVNMVEGSSGIATVIRDEIIPFEIRSNGFLLFSGEVQDRVARHITTDELQFNKRIRNTSGLLTSHQIDTVTLTGFSGFTTDTRIGLNSVGTTAPATCARSGDGDLLTFHFSPALPGAVDSKFFVAATEATEFAIQGTMTITLTNGISTTIPVAIPVIDTTSPIVRIDQPAPRSCVCSVTTIRGVSYDPEGTFTSDLAEYAADPNGPWTTFGTASVPVGEPGGVLHTWNTSGLAEGWYSVRLTAFNDAGLSTSVVTSLFVSQTFDTLSVGSPSLAGGNVCVSGTIWDENCEQSYTIEYADAGTTSFTPVDATSPTYDGRRINQTTGVWRTLDLSIPDGDYDLRVTATNGCDDSATTLLNVTVDNTTPIAVITSHVNCERIVPGAIAITGIATDANLRDWTLQYTGGPTNDWVTIASGVTPVDDDVLAVWDTSSLPACTYTVRLIATDRSVINCSSSRNRAETTVSVDVGCPGDFERDDDQDVLDLLAFLDAWFAVCP